MEINVFTKVTISRLALPPIIVPVSQPYNAKVILEVLK